MAETPKISKFETVDLAAFYSKNGSEFSNIGPAPGQFDFTSPNVDTNTDKTPVSKLAQMVQEPSSFGPTPEKSTQDISTLASTPQKTTQEPIPFGPTPEKTAPNVSALAATPRKTTQEPIPFGATPEKTTPEVSALAATLQKTTQEPIPFGPTPEKSTVEVFPLPASPEKIGIEATSFTFSPAFVGTTVSAFGFVPGFTTPDLSIVNGTPDIDATGFTKEMQSTQFTGISGQAFNSPRTSTQLGFVDGKSPHHEGFSPNQTYPNSLYTGISGTEFSSPGVLNSVQKIHNGIADIDAIGFITNKNHLGPTDYTGVTGNPGTMQYKMATVNAGNTSTWTRMQYNDKVGGRPPFGLNNQDDIAQTGFTTAQRHKDASGFIDISGNTYTYPGKAGSGGSYQFNTENYLDIFNDVRPNTAGTNDGQGQQFRVAGGTGPGGDLDISAKKSQFDSGDFKKKVDSLYTRIPGVGDTDLRKESTNIHSFGDATDQPFIQRDIGSNWSLFSDSPASKGAKGGLFGIDLIRGGVGTAINRSLIDALRIGKFLISPKGLLFIAKSVGQQLTNPKVQMDKILGLGANRVYPLGLSTLAQTLTNAVGIHLVRHGLGPLNGTLPKNARYEDNVYASFGSGGGGGAKAAAEEAGLDVPDMSDVTGDVPELPNLDTGTPMGAGNKRSESRLVYLATDMQSGLFAFEKDSSDGGNQSLSNIPSADSLKDGLKRKLVSKLPAAVRGMSKVKITRLSDKNFLGPHSVYGIGGTTIYRSSAGVGIGQHEETGGTFSDSKYLTSGGQDVIFKQEQGDRITQNPSFARIYNTSNDGDKYSDQYGGNVSGKDNFRSDADSNSDAYDRMTDLADTNPYKSRQAIRHLGHEEAGIKKPDQETFVTDNEELHDVMGDFNFENEGLLKGRRQWNRHTKYTDKVGVGLYDEMLGDFQNQPEEPDPEAEGETEVGSGGPYQSPLTQRFSIEDNDGINSPDDLAELRGAGADVTSNSNLLVSQNQRIRRYQTLTYGLIPVERTTQKLMDFRELLTSDENQNFHRPNGGDNGEGAPWGGKDRVARFKGDYGAQFDPDGGGLPQRGDVTNNLGLEDASVDMTDPENPEYKPAFDDLIRVKFSTATPEGEEAEQLQFRAYMTGLSDNISPSWQEVTYVGRTSPLYLFESMGREIGFDLKMAAGTKNELIANYKRLNRFMQLISPEYKGGLPVAPLLKITIGDWFIDTPLIVDKFDLAPNDQSPWDIDEGRQLPFYLDLSIGGKILFADNKSGDDVVQSIYSRGANYFGAVSRNFEPAGIYSPQE